MPTPYIGRFAPSPSGPLHLGSLLAALGSFLRARSQQGRWLVRIDDIDPPREMPGAADTILRQLNEHGLYWDGDVVYQSQRSEAYEEVLASLQEQHLIYGCQCTRAQIQRSCGGRHDMIFCRQNWQTGQAESWRLANRRAVTRFVDRHLGPIELDGADSREDFIVKRKDGLYAYHLASVVDDHWQGITEVVRGADLLHPTACQLSLFNALNWSAPDYFHLPVLTSEPGKKLSKQNHAAPIEAQSARQNLLTVLPFLGFTLPEYLQEMHVDEVLQWAISHWCEQHVPRQQESLISPAPQD